MSVRRGNSDLQEKKEEICLSPMTKAPTPTEKTNKLRDNKQTPPKIRYHNDLHTDLCR